VWPAPGKAGKNGDGVRWTSGAPNSPGENARGDNVKVVSGGRRLTQSGIPSDSSNPNKENDTHIPAQQWQRWKDWNAK